MATFYNLGEFRFSLWTLGIGPSQTTSISLSLQFPLFCVYLIAKGVI